MKKFNLILAILFLVSLSANAQWKKVRVGVNAGVNIPVTELANVYSIAPSAEFNFGYRITPSTELLLTTSYGKSDFRTENLNDDIHQLDEYAGVTEQWTMTVIPITAGIRYMFDPITPKIIPYGTAELGAYLLDFNKRLGGDIKLTGSVITKIDATKESDVGFGLALGVGTFFEVAPRVSLDVVVKFNFVKADFVKDYLVTKDTLAPVNVAGISTGMFLTTRAVINIRL
jgi:opacity protein-like surface antigen